VPLRTCVGCRARGPQAALVRFVRPAGGGWGLDAAPRRAAGRGAYLCSQPCAQRVAKNKRYPGLAEAARAASWDGRPALCDGSAAVYDRRVPRHAPLRD